MSIDLFDFSEVEFQDYTNSKNPKLIYSPKNFECFMKHFGFEIRFNILSKDFILLQDGEVVDINFNFFINKVLLSFQQMKTIVHISQIESVIKAMQKKFNPIEEYILSKDWDGKSRLNDFYDILEVLQDENYKVMVLNNFLIQSYLVGMKRENSEFRPSGLLVLQGPQGCGKTSFLQTLAPSDLIIIGQTLDINSKDSIAIANRYWFFELGELDATFKKSDIAGLKSYIDKSADEYRAPYARSSEKMTRRSNLVASVNDADFLRDTSGNRRYWILECVKCHIFHKVDMQQLWAEIHYKVSCGSMKLKLDQEWFSAVNEVNTDFIQETPLESVFCEVFDISIPRDQWVFFSWTEISRALEEKDSGSSSKFKDWKTVCAKFRIPRHRSNKKRGYLVPPLNVDKTQALKLDETKF